jgi:hypothetical protein
MTKTEFLKKTNEEYSAWCKTYYRPEALDERGMVSLHGLWAWQEQEKRVAELEGQVNLLRDAILRTCCNSEGVVCLRGSYDGRTILQEALAATEPKP